MQLLDYLLIGAVALLLGIIVLFVIRAKKKGKKCIGCPSSRHCSGCNGCSGNCGQ